VEFLNSGDSHSTLAQYKAGGHWIQGFGRDFLTNGAAIQIRKL